MLFRRATRTATWCRTRRNRKARWTVEMFWLMRESCQEKQPGLAMDRRRKLKIQLLLLHLLQSESKSWLNKLKSQNQHLSLKSQNHRLLLPLHKRPWRNLMNHQRNRSKRSLRINNYRILIKKYKKPKELWPRKMKRYKSWKRWSRPRKNRTKRYSKRCKK